MFVLFASMLAGWTAKSTECLELVCAKLTPPEFICQRILRFSDQTSLHIITCSLLLTLVRLQCISSVISLLFSYLPFLFAFQQAFLGGLVLLSELLPIPLPIRSLEVCN